PLVQNFTGFDSLQSIGSNVLIALGYGLSDLQGLNQLHTVGGNLTVRFNNELTNLAGLDGLQWVGGSLTIFQNLSLTSLTGLEQLAFVGQSIAVNNNPALSECDIYSFCNLILNVVEEIILDNNAPGCNSLVEAESACNTQPVHVRIVADVDENCQAGAPDLPGAGVWARLVGGGQINTREAGIDGIVSFGYLSDAPFFLALPQYPNEHWSLCQDTIWVDPSGFQDTIFATFLLQPQSECPELITDLGLPPTFRGCLSETDIDVQVRNTGAAVAEAVQISVLLPLGVLEIINTSIPITFQNGDTLFFQTGNLLPFEAVMVSLRVRTQCDTFLYGQTLCAEAFSTAENDCMPEMAPFSEIRLSTQCIDDEMVQFTLRNIGNAPTQSPHDFVIIEDEVILLMDDFNLNPNEERTVDLPANGSTYRMEATRFDNGILTAVALENCGGLTPGLITTYWLDQEYGNRDFDCREVALAYDPNQKTAIPKGVGESHLTAANRPIQYTIEFQNTGTDTAFRVLLRDVLSQHLDVNTFRPGFSSHPYSWEIRGLDTLNVLFFPIELPDSNVNVAGSQGFFTFTIDQKPDLPDGTVIENTADIVFDYNPPIVTNTVFHTIGELVVNLDEPAPGTKPRWKVFANPVKESATFQAIVSIPGEKQFELFDAAGRKVRTDRIDGQEFLFQRKELPGGVYFFRIADAQGRSATGKIVIAE
ncbi:MAG: T9SS type A sorting domain-containing protein, partial [Saprospiraceae bacterium]|nr:T9SS type A sorting domain-containing protein [Saprospiraceae bacterium]